VATVTETAGEQKQPSGHGSTAIIPVTISGVHRLPGGHAKAVADGVSDAARDGDTLVDGCGDCDGVTLAIDADASGDGELLEAALSRSDSEPVTDADTVEVVLKDAVGVAETDAVCGSDGGTLALTRADEDTLVLAARLREALEQAKADGDVVARGEVLGVKRLDVTGVADGGADERIVVAALKLHDALGESECREDDGVSPTPPCAAMRRRSNERADIGGWRLQTTRPRSRSAISTRRRGCRSRACAEASGAAKISVHAP
jgi:hypothetical protein